MSPLTAIAADKRQGRRIALLVALLLGYGGILYFSGDEPSRQLHGRYLESFESTEEASRLLAKNAASPPTLDEIPGEYIVKPWVGYAASDVWETKAETRLTPAGAQASSSLSAAYTPRNAVDFSTNTAWRSYPRAGSEWLTIDMGLPVSVAEVYVAWHYAYARDYVIQAAKEKKDCRADGESCPDAWTDVVSVSGKGNANPTSNTFNDDDHALQGVRYLRLKMDARAPGYSYFSVYFVQVFRKAMIVGENPTGTNCGSTVTAVTNGLLSKHGGTLIQSYENAEFFAASMSEAQKDAMFADPCTFTVEPNYVVRARWAADRGGGEGERRRRDDQAIDSLMEEKRRRLAIPEFNLQDENPSSWGLERIASMGKRNGKYKWIHEGMDTHTFVFDTGLYPDHSDWDLKNGTSRLGSAVVCAGLADDYASTNHGTHVASVATGQKNGVAKSSVIRPIQVLNANGEGSTASVLCGVERVLQEGIDYNAANAPVKMRGIVNLSLGVDGRSDALDKVVKDLTDAGFTVVIAAGDHDDNACFYSPYDPTAITVGALKDDEEGFNDKTDTSNYGECIDVWAPGEDILAGANTGEYDSALMSGTSVAAAFASGVAALYFEGLNTHLYEAPEFSAVVKNFMLNNAELDSLGEIGYGSPNAMLQTTASMCQTNAHCGAGMTCLFDGVCLDTSGGLKKGQWHG